MNLTHKYFCSTAMLFAILFSFGALLLNSLATLFLCLSIFSMLVALLSNKKSQQANIEKVHWYEQIIDSVPLPLSVTNMDMKWTFVNKVATEPLGVSRESVLGKPCNNWGANICKTPDCGIECLRRDGSKTKFHQWDQDFEVETTYLHDTNGNKIGHIEVVTNVTDTVALSKIFNSALEVSKSLNTHSIQVSEVGTNLSSSTSELDSTVGNMASSLTEIKTKSESNASSVVKARETASEITNRIDSANNAMEKLVNTMENLSKTSSSISSVIQVIDGIAEQTNLLALNAAIEAARAGEQGRGFAVVSDEVRTLAQRSSGAAQETTTLINESMQNAVAGQQAVDDVAKRLANIVTDVKELLELMEGIDNATKEQTSSIEEVTDGLDQVRPLISRNTGIAEKTAGTSKKMLESTTEMSRILNDMARVGSLNEQLEQKNVIMSVKL